jgi:hypothetical protein
MKKYSFSATELGVLEIITHGEWNIDEAPKKHILVPNHID